MISVDIVFLFIAAVAFLGFVLNAAFERIRIVYILPLMLIGVLVGPVLGFVNTGSGSVISTLTPYITAITIAIILFDVGLNINIRKLSTIIAKATAFTFAIGVATGVATAILTSLIFGWTMLDALIFGFAIAGTTTIGMPMIVKLIKLPDSLKAAIVYESIVSDTYQLIVPTLIFTIIATGSITIPAATYLVLVNVFGAIILGGITALFWLYVMRRFENYSREYGWLLTLTMIIATYAIADEAGFSGLLTVFVFGILFATIGKYESERKGSISGQIISRYLFIGAAVDHIKEYQKEIAFFTSTFFFVYLGLLFQISAVSYTDILAVALICVVIVVLRFALAPKILRGLMSKPADTFKRERMMVSLNMARGLSPAIVATFPLVYGVVIPEFVNSIFLVILFTNVIATAGIFLLSKPIVEEEKPDDKAHSGAAGAKAK
ncbi:MAG: cation:proton antiporter [Candidatus Micrarchaeota archaeon]|nr:cation:proton antiporter [Candidatus Micrarchaeota archaeon]